MKIEKTQTVKEIVVAVPGATRLFEKLGIDYCCGGGQSLEKACRGAGKSVEDVVAALEAIRDAEQSSASVVDWQQQSLASLISHILNHHHRYVREEAPRLEMLIEKICNAHGESRPEMLEVRSLIADLKGELALHMQKEEIVLFPYIEQLERASNSGEPAPMAPFGTVANPIQMMLQEHDDAGETLQQIQSRLTDRSGCPTTQEFFRSMDAFQEDLHQHIHLENNILFPRAQELERSMTVA